MPNLIMVSCDTPKCGRANVIAVPEGLTATEVVLIKPSRSKWSGWSIINGQHFCAGCIINLSTR